MKVKIAGVDFIVADEVADALDRARKDAVIQALALGWSYEDIAAVLGTSSSTLGRLRAKDPAFEAACEGSREKVRGNLMSLIWQHAESPSSKACGKSIEILTRVYWPKGMIQKIDASVEVPEADRARARILAELGKADPPPEDLI